jgi:hypothetical protein
MSGRLILMEKLGVPNAPIKLEGAITLFALETNLKPRGGEFSVIP